ncbi:MAG: hypothetical protein QW520_03920 [Methanomassiliicoccales archaeon]
MIHERQTLSRFKRKAGKLYRDNKGRKGRIDLIIVGPDGINYGIEFEYPRGKGKERTNFMCHILNDAYKLKDACYAQHSFILVFLYHDYETAFLDEVDIKTELDQITLFLIRLPKKGEMRICHNLPKITRYN